MPQGSVDSENAPGVREVLAQYPELEAARVTPIERGLIHQTFRVELSPERRYVLQALNPLFSPLVHENIAAVTERLHERGVTTPRLCRTRDGALSALAGGRRWRLLTHVEGVGFDRCQSPAHARAAGALVARFHSALEGLPHEFHPLGFPFHEPARHFADLERALAAHTDHPLHAEVAALAVRIRAAAAEWQPLDDLPAHVVHLDLKFNNLLFVAGSEPPLAASLIDLDTLGRRPLWVELGDAWRSWCNRRPEHESEAQLDPAIFEASAEAWLAGLSFELSRAERESLAEGIERLTVELGTRFATDVLEERYFGWNAALFASAAEHNLSRARGQLSLHAQARETRADRLAFLLG